MKRNNKITAKILSMFLAILFVFYALPLSAIAEGISNLSSDNGTDIASSDSAANQSTEALTYLNDVYEDISLREESVKHFRLEDGSYIATQYSSPVHYRDESGAWQNIDNTLTESGSELVTSDARVKFIKKTTGNGSIFTLHDGNTKITLSLAGANKKVSGIVTNTEETETTEIGKLMSLEELTSRIRYNEILDGVDIEYVLDSLSIKENIIIKEKNDEYSYTFTLALNGLEAELLANGDISITKSGEQKYKIPAPVVFDSADSRAPATAAGYSLTDNGNGKYTLTVSVSSEWMNSSDRVYPVTLDPAVIKGSSSILDTYGTPGVTSGLASSTTLRVSDYITLVKLNALPALPTGAKVSNATLTMFRTSGTGGYVGASPINSSWSQTAVNVSDLTYGSVLDYAYTKANGDGSYGIDGNGAFVWDITEAVRSWYDGTANYGIALQRLSTSGDTFFASVEYSNSAKRPSFTISYVNTLGLEDYYSYSTQSGGAAGTGYVNYATGDLTFAISTLTSTDYLMPVTPTLVYNSALANKSYTSANVTTPYTSPMTSYGFKLNLTESLVRRSYSSEGATVYYYVWTDADGTEHFFYQDENDSTTFRDDSGLLLTLNVPTSGKPSITDIDKNVREFISYGSNSGSYVLRDIKDKVGNKVNFIYNTSNQISEIELYPGGSNEFVTLELYYTNGVLYQILNRKSNESVFLKYSATYNGEISSSMNYLRQVIYAHGTDSSPSWATFYNSGSATDVVADATMYYEYDANGYLLSARNGLANYTVNYEWANGKVSSVYEKGGTTQGTKIGFKYGTGYTEVTTPGSDGYYTSTADNIINHYTYDGFFRVLSHYSTSYDRSTVYGTSFGKYTDDGDVNKNKIQESTFANGISSNYILNGSFLITSDTDAVPYWETSHSSIEVWEDGRNAELKIPYTAGETYTVYQYVYLPVADKYTLSFDIETNYTKNIIVEADVLSGSTSLLESSKVNVDNINETDQRYTHSVTFEIYSASTVKVQFKVRQVAGATVANNARVYIANVRLEQGIGGSAFNYVNMGDFVDTYRTSSGDPTDVTLNTVWYDKSSTSYYTSGSHLFKNALKINGGLYNRYIKQTFYTAPQSFLDSYGASEWSTNTGATYIVSGFAKATGGAVSNSRGRFALRVDVYYYQGEGIDDIVVSHYFDFNSDSTDWQYVSGKFSTKYEPDEFVLGEFYDIVRKIDVVCEFKYQPSGSTAYFDKIAVVEDISGTTRYAYNDQGLLAITETSDETEYREYDRSGNLTRIANDSGYLCDFEYDEESELLKSETYYSFIRPIDEYRYDYKYPYTARNPDSAISKTPITKTEYEYNDYGQMERSETYPAVASGSSAVQKPGSASLLTVNTYETTAGSAIFGALLTTSDGAWHTQRYFYDQSRGYLLAEVNVEDRVGTAYAYDAIGNLVSVKPATCNSTGTSYSTVNNAESVTYTYNTKNELASITTGSTTYSFTYDALGRMSAYTNDNIRYYYTPDGKLSSMVYGSGEFEYRYTYDELGRLVEESYYYEVTEEWEEDGETYYDWYEVIEPIRKYEYTADGKLYRAYDVLNDEYTHYSYDISGRLEHVIQYDSDRLNDFSVNYFYNPTEGKEHLISSQFYFFNYSAGNETVYGQMWYDYDYNDDDSLKKLEVSSGEKRADLTYTYDDFKRPSTVTLVGKSYENYSYVNSGFTSTTTYGYKTVNGVTTGEVSNYTVNVGSITNSTTKNYTYTYDGRGNITSIKLGNTTLSSYSYDDLGQLIWEDVYNAPYPRSYEYTYDNAGNLTSRTEWAYPDGEFIGETYYTYSGDKLTSFGSESITYDAYGRTTFYRGKAITYYEYDFNRIQSIGGIAFTYDAEGMRKSKTVGGVTHYYTYDGLNLIKEEWGNNTLVFLYDASGSPIGMQYRNSSKPADDWDTYYYEKNLQGDIIAVYSATGTKLVTYDYDAWGDISYTTYYNGGAITSVVNNPLRYRGYYYDDDLDLYYLATRYYDPEVCRFITADSYVSTGQGILGYNRYAYCGNNPVMRVDPAGEFFIFLIPIVSSFLIVSAIVNIATVIDSENIVEASDVEAMSDDDFAKYDEDTDSTYGMSNEKRISYIRRLRQDEEFANNWTEADMLREMWYHDRGYEIATALGSDPTVEGTVAYRFNHVDFESEQTFQTYLFRFIGNLAFWGRK